MSPRPSRAPSPLAIVFLPILILGMAASAAPPLLAAAAGPAPPLYDLILRGGRIVDGTGAPWFEGDIAIRGDRIVAIGRLERAAAKRTIDVRGLFAKDRDALLELLVALDTADWTTATVCAGWNVHDVALHILGGDLTGVSRRRDGLRVTEPRPGEGRGSFLNGNWRGGWQWTRARLGNEARAVPDDVGLGIFRQPKI